MTPRVLAIGGLAEVVGLVSALVALALLKLIGLSTNLFFLGRVSTDLVSVADHHRGYGVLLVPVIGGLIVGLMARYGSERSRGHGMPEALEAVLVHGSRVQPRVALLKPISAAPCRKRAMSLCRCSRRQLSVRSSSRLFKVAQATAGGWLVV